MGLKLTNNAISRLAGSITSTATTINLITGDGALFPSLSAGDWFPATLIDTAGNIEVVKVTARSTDALTVTRAQEDTSGRAFPVDSRIELRLTAGATLAIQDLVATGDAALQTQVDTLTTNLATTNGNVSSLSSSTTASVNSLQSQINAIPTPEGLPVGFGPIPWSLPTEPTGWIFADGRVLTSGTYTALRTAYINAGFPFGSDGSGNPRIPDMRGRVPAGRDNMGGTATGRLTSGASGVDGVTLGAVGGAQTHTLTDAQMPYHTHSGSVAPNGEHAHSYTAPSGYWNLGVGDNSYNLTPGTDTTGSAGYHGHDITIGWAGGGVAHNNTQPTLITNYLIKV